MRVRWIVTEVSVDERAAMMAVGWRAGRGGRPAPARVSRGPERPARKETVASDIAISSYFNIKEEAHELLLTSVSRGDPQAQGGHPGHGFRPHPAGEQGRSLPPPAPSASRSLSRTEGCSFGRPSGLSKRARQVLR